MRQRNERSSPERLPSEIATVQRKQPQRRPMLDDFPVVLRMTDQHRSALDSAVQMIRVAAERHEASVHEAADRGTQGGGNQLPHRDEIQASFGRHDVSAVQAHVGGPAREASEAMGAEAFARGNHVAFKSTPDLHTAAHEAAHVVQQRAGVSLKDGVGQAGDAYERHADSVADKVVRGESSEALLGQMAGSSESVVDKTAGGSRGGGSPAVQHKIQIQAEQDDQFGGRYNSARRLEELVELIQTCNENLAEDPIYQQMLDALPPADLVADPRVRTLALQRNKFVFATWVALGEALEGHWDAEADDPVTAFAGAGAWAQAPPLPTRPLDQMNTALVDLLPGEPPAMDALVCTPPELLDVLGAETTPQNVHNQEASFRGAYNACGNTAQNLIATIDASGGQMRLVHEHQFEGMDAAGNFEELMMATVAGTTFFDVSIRQVHEFTIEKHADGRQVLHQGYLSGYNALWWAGHDDALIEPEVAEHPAVADARVTMGNGVAFDRATLRTLMGGLGDFMRTDVYGDPGSTDAWAALPFHPGETNPATYQQGDTLRANEIKILVKVFQPQDEAAALEALGGEDGDYLTTLVLNRVAEKWAAIQATLAQVHQEDGEGQ